MTTPPDPAPAGPARRRRALVVGASVLGGAALVAAAYLGGSALAEVRYASAYLRAAVAVGAETDAQDALAARLQSLSNGAARVVSVRAVPESAAVGPSAEALGAATDELLAFLAGHGVEPGEAPAREIPEGVRDQGFAPSHGDWLGSAPWERFTQATALDDLARAARSDEAQLEAAARSGEELDDRVEGADDAFFEALAVGAEGEIAANPLATKGSQVALVRLVEQARDRGATQAHDGALVSAVSAGRQAVVASQAAEQAELDDPGFAVRAEIEAYARSLSSGVALDFVWAPEVSGLGEGWLSGTAETYDGDGGWAVISLNYGVEQEWYAGDDARALVTHEVGHTQVVRDSCRSLFTGPAFGSDHEMWATAWSIGQGFDVPGSGIEAYGRPSDEQIAVAAGCR